MSTTERVPAHTLSDWGELGNCPARVTLPDPRTPDGTVKIPGTILEVTAHGIRVELFFPLIGPRPGTSALLEIVARTALIQCHVMLKESPSPQSLHLSFPDRVHALQRRRYPRASVSMSVLLTVPNHLATYPGRIFNISAGGCAMLIPQELPVGTELWLNLSATEVDLPQLQARVVRSLMSVKENGLWEVGAAFVGLTGNQEAHLIEFVTLHTN